MRVGFKRTPLSLLEKGSDGVLNTFCAALSPAAKVPQPSRQINLVESFPLMLTTYADHFDVSRCCKRLSLMVPLDAGWSLSLIHI